MAYSPVYFSLFFELDDDTGLTLIPCLNRLDGAYDDAAVAS